MPKRPVPASSVLTAALQHQPPTVYLSSKMRRSPLTTDTRTESTILRSFVFVKDRTENSTSVVMVKEYMLLITARYPD